MGSLSLYFSLVCALIFVTRLLPPDWKYLSPRKHRAVRLALCEFTATHELVKPDRLRCRVYHSDKERCIVMIPHYTPCMHPPVLSFYTISDDSDQVNHLGSGQCHWGIRPDDILKSRETVE